MAGKSAPTERGSTVAVALVANLRSVGQFAVTPAARLGNTCFGIWEPEKFGMAFVAQKGNPWPLGCDDVVATRAELEAKGVEFAGDILDTGVCHMAFFSDPDGNDLMLHHRYAPYD